MWVCSASGSALKSLLGMTQDGVCCTYLSIRWDTTVHSLPSAPPFSTRVSPDDRRGKSWQPCSREVIVMARPIKETPILKGKDARRFERALKENEKKSISSEERKRIHDAWQQFEVVVRKDG